MKYIHDLSGGIPLFAEVARNAIADESGNKISETYVPKEDFYETITAISSDKLDTSAFSTVSGNFITASYPFTTNLGGASKMTVYGQSNLEVNSQSNVIFANRTNFSAITDKLLQGSGNSCSEVSFVQGQYNTGAYCSMVQGLKNNAGNQSQAFGIGNVITNTGMAIGAYNKTSSDASFVIGNGTNSNNRSDLFIIKHDGTVSSTGDFIVDGKSLSNVHNTVSTNSGEWLKASDLNNYVTTSDLEITSGKLLTTAQYSTDSAAFALKEEIPSTVTQLTDSGNYYQKTDTSSKDEISNALAGKQDILSVGTNLEIVNGVIGVNTSACTANSAEYAFVEGIECKASGKGSHAEGCQTSATNKYSHAEGYKTIAKGLYSHAEGDDTNANGHYSHAEGFDTLAQGQASHTEGFYTTAFGKASHTEGSGTSAHADCAHAEGLETTAQAKYSHAGGLGTIANYESETVIGKYNISTYDSILPSSAKPLFVVGNGENYDNRSDSFIVTLNGIASATTLATSGISDIETTINGKQNTITFTASQPANTTAVSLYVDANGNLYYVKN